MFPAVRQRAVEITHRVCSAQTRIICQQPRGVFRDDEIAVRGNDRAAREGVLDSVDETPPAQVNGIRRAIVEFDIFVFAVAAHGIIHDLVDHDIRDAPASVRRARRFRLQPIEA